MAVVCPKIERYEYCGRAQEAPETPIVCKRVEHENEGVMMKVTPESMTYLYVAALQRGWRDVARTRPKKLDSAVRWSSQKKAWVAKRSSGPRYRVFRPEMGNPESRATKHRRALAWAQGDSGLSGSDAKADREDEDDQQEPAETEAIRPGASSSWEEGDMEEGEMEVGA